MRHALPRAAVGAEDLQACPRHLETQSGELLPCLWIAEPQMPCRRWQSSNENYGGRRLARSLSSPWPRPHAFSFAPCLRPVLPFELSQAEKTSLGTCQEAYGSAWRDGVGGAAATSQKHAAADVCKASGRTTWDAWLSDGSANLGVLLERDALANLGSAEMDDIVGKRITDIDLRRRRRKSSNQ
jgi:hypothetical protein